MPAGGLAQANGGEMFWPTQLGLDLLSPAFFTASRSPSLKADEDSVKGSAAWAAWAPSATAAASRMVLSEFMCFSGTD